MLQEVQDTVFQLATRKKTIVYRAFLVAYALIVALLIAGSIAIVKELPNAAWYYQLGVWSGRAAVTILALVLIPGMLGRFGIQIKVTRVLTFYRRQLGITTFLFSFTHGMLVRIVGRVALGWYPINRALLFEVFGTLALSLMFFLFVTSNDASVKRLGLWWKRLHRLVYVIVWFILFHTILQRVSVWSVIIGIVAIAELVSLLYTIRGKVHYETMGYACRRRNNCKNHRCTQTKRC